MQLPSWTKTALKIIVLVILIGAIVMLNLHWAIVAHWLWYHTVGSSSWVNGWGGIISDMGLVGAAIGVYYKHNCHQGGCWRISKHVVDGTPWCNKHHVEARKVANG